MGALKLGAAGVVQLMVFCTGSYVTDSSSPGPAEMPAGPSTINTASAVASSADSSSLDSVAGTSVTIII